MVRLRRRRAEEARDEDVVDAVEGGTAGPSRKRKHEETAPQDTEESEALLPSDGEDEERPRKRRRASKKAAHKIHNHSDLFFSSQVEPEDSENEEEKKKPKGKQRRGKKNEDEVEEMEIDSDDEDGADAEATDFEWDLKLETSAPNKRVRLLQLPEAVLFHVFSFVPLYGQVQLSSVCAKFAQVLLLRKYMTEVNTLSQKWDTNRSKVHFSELLHHLPKYCNPASLTTCRFRYVSYLFKGLRLLPSLCPNIRFLTLEGVTVKCLPSLSAFRHVEVLKLPKSDFATHHLLGLLKNMKSLREFHTNSSGSVTTVDGITEEDVQHIKVLRTERITYGEVINKFVGLEELHAELSVDTLTLPELVTFKSTDYSTSLNLHTPKLKCLTSPGELTSFVQNPEQLEVLHINSGVSPSYLHPFKNLVELKVSVRTREPAHFTFPRLAKCDFNLRYTRDYRNDPEIDISLDVPALSKGEIHGDDLIKLSMSTKSPESLEFNGSFKALTLTYEDMNKLDLGCTVSSEGTCHITGNSVKKLELNTSLLRSMYSSEAASLGSIEDMTIKNSYGVSRIESIDETFLSRLGSIKRMHSDLDLESFTVPDTWTHLEELTVNAKSVEIGPLTNLKLLKLRALFAKVDPIAWQNIASLVIKKNHSSFGVDCTMEKELVEKGFMRVPFTLPLSEMKALKSFNASSELYDFDETDDGVTIEELTIKDSPTDKDEVLLNQCRKNLKKLVLHDQNRMWNITGFENLEELEVVTSMNLVVKGVDKLREAKVVQHASASIYIESTSLERLDLDMSCVRNGLELVLLCPSLKICKVEQGKKLWNFRLRPIIVHPEFEFVSLHRG